MVIFDGLGLAAEIEHNLVSQVAALQARAIKPVVAAVLFREDQGSQLYTRLKSEAAARLGIAYQVTEFSLRDDVSLIQDHLRHLAANPDVTGVIIQKPWRQTWLQTASSSEADGTTPAQAFQDWWHSLVTNINPDQDVDGLHPHTLQRLQNGTWPEEGAVLPATCQAVWEIMQRSGYVTSHSTIAIIGKSDLLGLPLYYWLTLRHYKAMLLGKTELQARQAQGQGLLDADVVVSATGQPGVITGELVKPGVAIIDVGEPRPDVDVASLSDKAAFLTPVPGGVGPVTVSCLMANAVTLAEVQAKL